MSKSKKSLDEKIAELKARGLLGNVWLAEQAKYKLSAAAFMEQKRIARKQSHPHEFAPENLTDRPPDPEPRGAAIGTKHWTKAELAERVERIAHPYGRRTRQKREVAKTPISSRKEFLDRKMQQFLDPSGELAEFIEATMRRGYKS